MYIYTYVYIILHYTKTGLMYSQVKIEGDHAET